MYRSPRIVNYAISAALLATLANIPVAFSQSTESCEGDLVSPINQAEKTPTSQTEVYLANLKFIEDVTTQLKKEFVGWDETIDQVMTYISQILLRPSMKSAPLVVPLFGFPGYGKTSFVQRVVELLRLHEFYVRLDIKTTDRSIPSSQIKAAMNNRAEALAKNTNVNFLPVIVISIDEVQNLGNSPPPLAPQVQTDDKGLHRNQDQMRVEDFERGRREISEDNLFWWNSLGNGIHTSTSQTSAPQLVAKLIQIAKRYATYQKELAALQLAVSGIEARMTTIVGETRWSENVNTAFLNRLASGEATEAEKEMPTLRVDQINRKADISKWLNHWASERDHLLTTLTSEFSYILGDKYDADVITLKNAIATSPDEFYNHLQERVKDLPAIPVFNAANTLVFVSGNPTAIIQKAELSARSGANGAVNPEQLIAAVERIPVAEMGKFFDETMGVLSKNLQALASRWKKEDWKIRAPFSTEQWNMLLERRLLAFEEEFNKHMKSHLGMEVSAKFKFAPSMRQFISRESIDVFEGPRSFFTSSSRILDTLFSQIVKETVQHKLKGSQEFTIEFDSKKSVAMIASDRIGAPIQVRITSNGSQQIETDEVSEHRKTLQVAGQTMAMMINSKTIPLQVLPISASGGDRLDEMYPAPQTPHFLYEYHHALAVMTGLLVDQYYLSGHFTNYAQAGLDNADYIYNKVQAELDRRKESLKFLTGGGGIPSLNQIAPGWEKNEFIRRVYAQDRDGALLALYNQARDIAQEYRRVILQMANTLEANKRISNDQLKTLLVANYPKDSFWRFWIKRRGHAKNLRAILNSQPGRIPLVTKGK